jgi:hypothetical protein
MRARMIAACFVIGSTAAALSQQNRTVKKTTIYSIHSRKPLMCSLGTKYTMDLRGPDSLRNVGIRSQPMRSLCQDDHCTPARRRQISPFLALPPCLQVGERRISALPQRQLDAFD